MKNNIPAASENRRPLQWRGLTSVLVALSFLILVVTGVILFLSPPGRVANWTNWTMLSLRKNEWTGLHIWFSTLFLVGAVVHMVFNWRPLLGYFRDRLTRRVGFRWEWLVALALCGGVFAGTRAGIPPFSSLLALNERIKESWDQANKRAPIPHAELLTLAELVKKADADLAAATGRLQAAGITGVTPEIVVQKLADQNERSARQIYEIIMNPPGQPAGEGHGAGGPGWQTLAAYCASQNIALPEALARLQARGITAAAGLTLREIAVNNGYERPYELLDIIAGKSK